MAYRFWCGECGFKTPWGPESVAGRQHMDHYAGRHPGLRLGGQVEAGVRDSVGGIGCAGPAVVLLLFLIVAAACVR
ncbi:hypothetical protein [Streptomyces sp. NPDC001591]|uniref:hypothetical protein n=1 Tax=Streptomyces sp. NPDC001591 TaxID=3364589 RepID=UPI0036CAC30C